MKMTQTYELVGGSPAFWAKVSLNTAGVIDHASRAQVVVHVYMGETLEQYKARFEQAHGPATVVKVAEYLCPFSLLEE